MILNNDKLPFDFSELPTDPMAWMNPEKLHLLGSPSYAMVCAQQMLDAAGGAMSDMTAGFPGGPLQGNPFGGGYGNDEGEIMPSNQNKMVDASTQT